jgi:hypothetical protein
MYALHKILIDERLLQKTDPQKKDQELLVFSILGLMIIIISILGSLSTFIYCLLIFKNIIIAASASFFLFLVLFNLSRLMLITSINAYHTKLGVFHFEHELAYESYHGQDNTIVKDLKFQEIVNDKKDRLRKHAETNGRYRPSFVQRITFLLKLGFFAFLAIFFANGIELLLFSGQLNEAFDMIREIYVNQPDSWLIKKALTPDEKGFWILNSNSILLSINVLSMGLGWWKTATDIVFVLIFTIPLLLTYRSRRIFDSNYVRELALHEITISHYHHLMTDDACKRIENELLGMQLDALTESENQTA